MVSKLANGAVLSCEAIEENGLGYIPTFFQVEFEADRKTAHIISPKTDAFGAEPFTKSFLGSSLWSKGKGRSKNGSSYAYQLQMDFKANDTEVRVKMVEQGYRDVALEFRCTKGIPTKAITSKDSKSEYDTACSESMAKEVERVNPQVAIYIKMKLGELSVRDIKEAKQKYPEMFGCINRFRGNFPPIEEFIRSGGWKKSLTAQECGLFDYEEELSANRTLAELDPSGKFKEFFEAPGGPKEKLESCRLFSN